MTFGAQPVLSEDVTWLRLEHDSSVGAARRASTDLATRLGLAGPLVAEIGLAATEIAANVVKHAGHGTFGLSACRCGDSATVSFVAIDAGPGIEDVEAAMRDGHSTAGTLGIGLGAVARLATWLDVHSTPEVGTVVAAGFGTCEAAVPTARTAGLTRPMPGQDICGDGHAARVDGDVLSVALADGLGHGPMAASATSAALRGFLEAPFDSPAGLLMAAAHGARNTRGVAMAVAQLGPDTQLRYAAAGNITGQLLDGTQSRGLLTHPGIVGVNVRTAREISYDLPARCTIVLHSDGVSEKLHLDAATGVLRRRPQVIAATVLRDFGVRNDDASVLVLQRGTDG
jgi:anti-sigma regulatory factor (Ser/Thr protein kinase)